MLRLSFLGAAFAALLCVQGATATCCSGEPVKCPANETSSYAGTITYTSVCCADGKWACKRDGKGTAGHVCSSRGGTDKACPPPAPTPKCCDGKPKECPPPETSSYAGTITYTSVCCANGNWECQRNGKGTAGPVCASAGGTTDACPKPNPQCCNGAPKECPADEDSPYGKITFKPVCCADGTWACQRNGKGTVGSVCANRGGTTTACPQCCKSGPKKCPAAEETPYGTVTFNPVCCANGKWECQRNGKGTVGSVCAPVGGPSKQCNKCCKSKRKQCPPTEETKYGKVTYTPFCCGDGNWYCQRDGKGTAGHVCTSKKGITKQCPAGTWSTYGYWV